MTLADALRMTADESVAVVGGGGKTTAMFRLAREMVDRGGCAITTTTTRIFGAQIALAPAHVPAADATRERVRPRSPPTGTCSSSAPRRPGAARPRASPSISSGACATWFPGVCIVNEADGSRMRPFKAPADVRAGDSRGDDAGRVLVGADVFGQPLDAEHVHRPELVSALSGAPWGRRSRPRSWPASWLTPKGDARACRPAPGSSR